MFRVIWGEGWAASLYAPASLFGGWSSSGSTDAAFRAFLRGNVVSIVHSQQAPLSKLSWLVDWVCGCMAAGEQCASTCEVWTVWEAMSQCGVSWLLW